MARILGASLLSAVLVVACSSGLGSSIEPSASFPSPSTADSPSISPPLGPSVAPTVSPFRDVGLLLAFRAPSDNPATAVLLNPTSGELVDLGRANEVSWSRDGSEVHVVRQGPECVPTLRTVTNGGAVVTTVTNGLRSEDRAFTWSPDDRLIAFLRYHNGPPSRMCGSQGGTYLPEDLVTDLVVMAADGTARRVLASGGWPRQLAWSPDGARIAYLEWVPPTDSPQGRLSVVDVSTGAIRQLTGTLEVLDQLRWSLDGQEILIRYLMAGTESHLVAAVDSESGRTHDLFTVASGTHELAWSPDGSLAAAAVDVVINGALVGGDMAVWNVASATKTTLELGDVQTFAEPAWSPLGTWLAFSRVEAGGSGFGGIDVVTVDGVSRRQVPNSAGYELASWQP